jgi:hypothetical protein
MPRNARLIALLALVLALAAVVIYQWQSAIATPGSSDSRASAAASMRGSAGRATAAVPAVRLEALQAAQSQPAPPAAGRNPFRFQARLAPPPPPVALRPGAPGGAVDTAGNPIPASPPPPPPIPFKFIGIVQSPNQRLAVLSDNSTRDVFYGREGDVIDGRYRILRIGVESVEMAYLDGRGRQTIRLTGS